MQQSHNLSKKTKHQLSMITCTRKFHFDSAHRVMQHENKCKLLHGHRYVVEATFTAKNLDNLGRIIDFSVIKDLLGSWLDNNFDHNTILHQDDSQLGEQIAKITGQKIYYLPCNPTAENIAWYLHTKICPMLFDACNISCVGITVFETPNCFAQIK